MSPSSPTSITARRRWSTPCCAKAAISATARCSRIPFWIPIRWNASAASPSWPRTWPSITPIRREATKINLIDTPGHADFGGEVERVLAWPTACSCWWMPPKGRCRRRGFVLKKAFQHELRPIVVINKIDRPDARATQVLDEVFDLFVELGADDETLDFPVLYASGRAGTASWDLEEAGDRHHSGVRGAAQARSGAARRSRTSRCRCRSAASNTTTTSAASASGRIYNGKIKTGQQVTSSARRHADQEQSAAGSGVRRPGRKDVEEAASRRYRRADRLESVDIGDSICDPINPQPLEAGDRAADADHDVQRQRFALRRQGRQIRHQPQSPRAAYSRNWKATSP
jgi:predicted membrane GTPase involved in stress response